MKLRSSPTTRRRVLAWFWFAAQWLFLCCAWGGVLVLGVREFKDSSTLTEMTGTAHWIGEIAVRTVLALPILALIALLLHPVRARRWMLRRGGALARWIGRNVPHPALFERAATLVIAPVSQINKHFTAPAPRQLSRRRFLAESALVGGAVAYSTFIEPYWLDVTRVELPIANLPARFVGMRVAQLSDMHTNAYTTAEDLARAVAIINGLHPDIVVLTGDFVDFDAKYADDATVPFTKLQAPEGVFSVLGNHDYYTGDITRIRWALRRQDLGLLVNQHTVLRRGADTLTIIGLDDPKHDGRTRGLSTASIDPAAALRGVASDSPRLMLLHNPILVPHLMQQYQLDVILCGHTHGGQFRVPIVTDEFVKRTEYFVKGRYDLGGTHVYVNRGFGFTGPPIRFRARPELTLLTLVKA